MQLPRGVLVKHLSPLAQQQAPARAMEPEPAPPHRSHEPFTVCRGPAALCNPAQQSLSSIRASRGVGLQRKGGDGMLQNPGMFLGRSRSLFAQNSSRDRAAIAIRQPAAARLFFFFLMVWNKYAQETLLRENFSTFSVCSSLGVFWCFLTKVLAKQKIPSVWLFFIKR